MAEIRLNKKNKTIKVVNRRDNLRLQHAGKIGPKGDQGIQGIPGVIYSDTEPSNTGLLWVDTDDNDIEMVGVPNGGTTGQSLVKTANTDYSIGWSTQVGSVNAKTGASITLTPDDLDDSSTSNKFVTATDITNLGNLSGVNTGDQDLSSYATDTDLSVGLAGKVTANASITGATKTKITYDAKGLVTAGADATTADIADSTNKRYITDAQQTTLSNTSGTNTGDETTSTIKTKLGITTLSGSNTGDQDLSTYQLKPSEGAFVNGDKTKLDGIEALADVTDATNVAAAGAVMDGDFSTNGLMGRTAAGTYTNRTITGTTNQITVINGDGVAGNPTLSLPQDIHTGASPTFAGQTLTGDSSQTSSATAQWSFRGAKQYFTAPSFGNNAGVQYGIQATETDATDANFAIDRLNYQGNFVSNLFSISSSGNATYYGNQTPNIDSTYTNGTPLLYWKESYTDRLYLNSTAYLDGATAGTVAVTGNISATNLSGTNTGDQDLSSYATKTYVDNLTIAMAVAL